MFGGTTFNKPASTGFGTTGLFGNQQPAASNTLFGNTTATATTQATGIFGGTATTGFGQNTAQNTFGFGQTQPQANTGGGLFGSTGQATSLFSTPTTSNSGFGTKTPGFGTSTQQSTGLFGATPAAGSSLFGNTTTSTASGGLFGGTTAAPFNANVSQQGTCVKFNPPAGQDTMLKGGQTTNISTRHQCITAMKEYENKSIEELRTEDYTANRKGPQPGSTGTLLYATPQTTQAQTGFGSVFGQQQQQQQQQNKPTGFAFGQTSTGTSSAASSLFTQTQSGGLFGATASTSKPLFGTNTTTTTASSGFTSFGPNTGSTLFGTNQNKSLFGQPTASSQSSIFGATQTPASSGFGSFGSSAGFGTTTSAGGLFGNKPTAFGQPAAASSTGLTFGQNTATGTGMFGNKPVGQATTGFSFNQNQSTGFGTNTTSGLFGTKPTGFGQPAASTTGLTFGQTTSTGTSLFGNKPVGQAATGFNLGQTASTGFGLGNTGLGQNTLQSNVLSQPADAAQAQNAQIQQVLTLTNTPYGDSPLFRNLTDDTSKREDLLKPTNPVAQKAALAAGNQYKVSPRPTAKIKPKPLHALVTGKSQLFDGLEDEESSFGNDTFVPRRSIKKLVIKGNDSMSNASFSKQSSHTDGADLDESRAALSPEQTSDHKENGVKFTNPLPVEKEDVGRSSVPKDIGRNIATGLFKNVNESFLNDTISDFNPRSRLNGPSDVSRGDSTGDIDTHSQDSETPPTPHPAGLVLRRHGYYILPSLEDLTTLLDDNGDCQVEDLVIGRDGFGNVMFPGITNVANMNFDDIVHFRRKEVTIYPDDSKKPPEGSGLNKKAQVTLDCVWPSDKTTREYIKEPSRLHELHYQNKLERATAKIGAKFLDYRAETGSWVFEVKHFSKYGLLDDSDDEDDSNVDPKKLKLLKSQQQQQLAIQKKQIEQVPGQPAPPPVQNLEVDRGKGEGYNQWAAGQTQAAPEPVTMDTAPRPLFSDEEEFDDLMDEGVPKEMGEIDDVEQTDLAPSSHRLANRLGVLAEELQLRKASFFGDDEDDFVPKWKASLQQPHKGLLKSDVAADTDDGSADLPEHSWLPPQSLLATSFSRQTARQISPRKRAPQAQPGLPFPAPFSVTQKPVARPTDHILMPATKTRPIVGMRKKKKVPTATLR